MQRMTRKRWTSLPTIWDQELEKLSPWSLKGPPVLKKSLQPCCLGQATRFSTWLLARARVGKPVGKGRNQDGDGRVTELD